MSTIIQIRHVPESVHRTLKSRAALEGLSLSDYLLKEVAAIAERPTIGELQARIASRGVVDSSESMASAVRSERDSHRTGRVAARDQASDGQRSPS